MDSKPHDEQGSILAAAATAFRGRQANVYRQDPGRVGGDVNAQAEATADHLGRWPLELLQNSEDAHASEVVVRVTEQAIYVADNGTGLQPGDVESVSGMYRSIKEAGIGRKGIGFKAVYEVTDRPSIFSGKEGIGFCPERAARWMHQEGLPVEAGVPHAWLPFGLTRAVAEQEDPTLAELGSHRTVVRLPLSRGHGLLQTAVEELREMPAHMLLAFRHLRSVRVEQRADVFVFTASALPGEGSWLIEDSRDGSRSTWACLRRIHEVPQGCLDDRLTPRQRERLKEAEVLIASPIREDGVAVAVDEHVPLLVYYPTDHPAPLPLVMHGEFLVSSDRRRVTEPRSTPFNDWLADRLAEAATEYIINAFEPGRPEAFIHLLRPHQHVEEHPITKRIWGKVHARVRQRLRLPDSHARLTVPLDQAQVLNVSVASDEARAALRAMGIVQLVHCALEQDRRVQDILRHVGCTSLDDAALVRRMRRYLK